MATRAIFFDGGPEDGSEFQRNDVDFAPDFIKFPSDLFGRDLIHCYRKFGEIWIQEGKEVLLLGKYAYQGYHWSGRRLSGRGKET